MLTIRLSVSVKILEAIYPPAAVSLERYIKFHSAVIPPTLNPTVLWLLHFAALIRRVCRPPQNRIAEFQCILRLTTCGSIILQTPTRASHPCLHDKLLTSTEKVVDACTGPCIGTFNAVVLGPNMVLHSMAGGCTWLHFNGVCMALPHLTVVGATPVGKTGLCSCLVLQKWQVVGAKQSSNCEASHPVLYTVEELVTKGEHKKCSS